MNKAELINAVAAAADVSKKDAEAVISATLDAITGALKEGEKVQLVGFGSFEVKKRAARIGRNPKTKESIEIPASVVPVFKAGKALKETVSKYEEHQQTAGTSVPAVLACRNTPTNTKRSCLMRLDKYLKVSRLIKRRTVANEACDNGLVSVNGKPQRASYEVKIGDQISLRFGARTLTVEVVSVQETVKQADAVTLYKEIGR